MWTPDLADDVAPLDSPYQEWAGDEATPNADGPRGALSELSALSGCLKELDEVKSLYSQLDEIKNDVV